MEFNLLFVHVAWAENENAFRVTIGVTTAYVAELTQTENRLNVTFKVSSINTVIFHVLDFGGRR